MTAAGPRNGTCVRPPHPENAEHAAGDDTQVVVMAPDSALSRFRRWVAYAPAERTPLPAIPAAWTAAEIMHMASLPVMYPAAGAVAAAGLAYGLAARKQGSQDGDDGAEKFRPAEMALITGGTGAWLALGDAAGPLSGGWPPWVSLGYLAAAGVAWAWLKMHPATRDARARKQAADRAAALETERKAQWHQLAAMVGLRGSHLLKFEETYLGDRRLVSTRGTGKRASALATAHLAEHLAELEDLPKGRVDVYPDAIAGRLWIDVRRIDPWRKPAMHPAATGQLDPAAEFAQFTPPKATVREPVTIGIDPDTGAPLQVRLWDPRDGAKVITVIAKKGGGKTVLLDNLTERITACDDAVLIQVNLSKALEDRWWEPLSAASALDGDAGKALMILNFTDQLITQRPRGGRTTRVHQPVPEAPLYVLKLDEIDRLASIPDAKTLLQLITSKCRSEGVTLIMAGQRGTAQWTGGGDVQSQVDIAIYGKFARDSRERGHVAGADANLPSMSEYGEGHPGVFGVTDLPPEGEVDKGRTFYWGESSAGIQRLIAARARTRRPLRQLEPALRALQPLWDAITSAAAPAGGYDSGGYDSTVSPPAAAAAAAGPGFTRPDVQFGAGGQVVPGTEQTRAKIGAALDSLAAADQTVAAVADVDDSQWAAAVAQRRAQALAQNYGDTDVPGPVMQVLIPLLADPAGTTARLAGEAIEKATGSGSRSAAHRYLQALCVAGIARLDGSGRNARFRHADSPVPAGTRPGLTVVPEDDTAPAAAPAAPAASAASAGPARQPAAGPEGTEAAVNRLLGDAIRLVTEFEFASEKFLAKRLRCQPHEAAGLIGALQALNIIRPDPDTPGAFDAAVTARDITAAITGQPGPQAAAGGDAQ